MGSHRVVFGKRWFGPASDSSVDIVNEEERELEVGGHHVQGTYMGQGVGVGGRMWVRRRMDVIKDGELGRMNDSGRTSWCMEARLLRAVRRLAKKLTEASSSR